MLYDNSICLKFYMADTVFFFLFRYAILCGYVSEFEGLQNKINCGHLFKVSLGVQNVSFY